jgi:hypothetical protein
MLILRKELNTYIRKIYFTILVSIQAFKRSIPKIYIPAMVKLRGILTTYSGAIY